MFEANPFVTVEHIGAPFALEASVHTPSGDRYVVAQKAHDVRTLEGAQAVKHKGAINLSQLVLIIKKQISSIFALGGTPIIREGGKGFENLALQWVSRLQQAVEQLAPVGLKLRICQDLSTNRVGQFDETVIGPTISQTSGIHLLGQPEPAIDTNVNAEGIPRFQAHVEAAHHWT